MATHSRYRPRYFTSPRWLPKTAPAGVAVGAALATSTATAEGIAIAEAAGSAVAFSIATAEAVAIAESVGAATAFSIATADGEGVQQPVAEVGGMVRRRYRRRKPVIVGAGVGEIALEARAEARVIVRGSADVTHEVATTAGGVNVHRQNEQALALLLLLGAQEDW